MPNNYFIYNGELYHYGVKGMKWGVRRKRLSEAKAARKMAVKKSMAESRMQPDSFMPGSGMRAIAKARKAGKQAYKKSIYESGSDADRARMDKRDNSRKARVERGRAKLESRRAIADKRTYGEHAARGVIGVIGTKAVTGLTAGALTLTGHAGAASVIANIGGIATTAIIGKTAVNMYNKSQYKGK